MTSNEEQLRILLEKLEALTRKQELFSDELRSIKDEINFLKANSSGRESVPEEAQPIVTSEIYAAEEFVEPIKPINTGPPEIPTIPSATPPKTKADVEHYIGSNIISKIGIAITIIGVGIGAQYSIEHDLISPFTRICLGYLVGLGLLGVGFRLKKAYTDFSAVLVSGAIAIMYFITYAAYTFYAMMPQAVAFALMVLFTVLTIGAAMNYNRQVIAHIGLVGAYAVPFLLSNDSGNTAVLFTYMAIINTGILIIAIKKYWKPLYYSSFILTWLIFSIWYVFQYEDSIHYQLFWIFSFLFYITFYLIFISYKLLHQEKFRATDVMLILSNSFIFYGLGYTAMDYHQFGSQYLGLFTLANAMIHLAVTLFIYIRNIADRNLFSLVAGLVLVFVTIAIPVQLDGSWVTLLWAAEAVLLFWIGRMRRDEIYEHIAYALIFLASLSIIGDWMGVYHQYDPAIAGTRITPLLNIHFLTSLLFIASLAVINYLNRNREESPSAISGTLRSFMNIAIPSILLAAIYFAFRIELTTYWDQLYLDSSLTGTVEGTDYPTTYFNQDLTSYKVIWTLNYSFLFFCILAYLNLKRIKSKILTITILAFGSICMMAFLSEGLLVLNQLRDSYLLPDTNPKYTAGSFNMAIRYISFAFAGLMLYSLYGIIRHEEKSKIQHRLSIAFDLLLHLSVLSVVSNEWITIMTALHYSESTRLGLSIVWGIYALLLIVLGIWKGKQHLRIGAIVLFAVTLIKLAVYDLTHLDTIAKTVVFVSLGILLLIISFLYNKYKDVTQVQDSEKVRQ